ncbi:sodium:proton antiporter [Parvularcula marina]|uniref:Na+/H+ antiporter subunit C n=1 Tax=Parvularcula marina TaxID=2292771 RepID=A0A371RKC0_9PROT|nr:cation:proton antiporter subunit C [Parvularcula marina]RFB05905.1 Na+/H+ antiporter subunit C [Parvularcula marina]
MIDFILARYNYWIVIILMLTGLYIVYSRGNLVKTVIGLNVFQTSVFIFYITLGKVVGGTAPILLGAHSAGHGGPSARGAAGGDHGDGHGADGHDTGGHGEDHAADPHQAASSHEAPVHADVQHGTPLTEEEALEVLSGQMSNSLEPNAAGDVSGQSDVPAESLHDFSEIDASNSLTPQMPDTHEPAPVDPGITITPGGHETAADPQAALDAGHEAMTHAAEVVYSNPLPHVLILTAIVVGVATTAVGLALAVRIREAYGTIEEDALERMDNEAATGSPTGEGGKA